MAPEETPEISVIITCYFEERSIDEFYGKLSAALAGTGRSYEIIFVNDGSTDNTFEKLKALQRRDPRISVIIDLFKNAGQAAAMTAGFTHARGNMYVFLDSDLQLEPAEFPLLLAVYDEGFEIVSGCRKNRKDSWSRIIPSKIANMIMRRVSKSNFTDFGCTFKIYDARLIRAFEYDPFKVFVPAHVIAHAQRCREVPVTHYPRKYGKSGWTFRKLFTYNMENLVSISDRPFQLLSVICLLCACLFIGRIALELVFPISVLPNITNGLILNFLFVGLLLILSVLSAIGEFIIRNFNMLQRRPKYIVKTLIRQQDIS